MPHLTIGSRTSQWMSIGRVESKQLSKLAAGSAVPQPTRITSGKRRLKNYEKLFLAAGGLLPVQQSMQTEVWSCDVCAKTFASKRALASHAGRAHGYRRIVKFYAWGDTCNSCCKWYHTQRFIEHLKDVPACLQVCQSCFPAMDDKRVQALDKEDHATTLQMRSEGWWATKALTPARRLYGPCLPPANSPDADQMLRRWGARTQPAGTAFQNLQGQQVNDNPAHPEVRLFEDDMPSFVLQPTAGPNKGDGRLSLGDLARDIAQKMTFMPCSSIRCGQYPLWCCQLTCVFKSLKGTWRRPRPSASGCGRSTVVKYVAWGVVRLVKPLLQLGSLTMARPLCAVEHGRLAFRI